MALKNWRMLKISINKFMSETFLCYQTDPLTDQVFKRVNANISRIIAGKQIVYEVITTRGRKCIAMAGERAVVLDLKEKLLERIRTCQAEIQDEKNVIKMTIPNIPMYQIVYLNLVEFFKTGKEFHKLVSFDGDESKKSVTIEGRPGSVDAVQEEMLGLLNKISGSRVVISKKAIFVAVLDTDYARQSIEKLFLTHKIEAVWTLENKTVSIYSASKAVSSVARDCIESAVWEAQYPADHSFDDVEKELLNSSLWRNKKADLQKFYPPLEIEELSHQSALSISGLAQNQASVLEDVPQFFEQNTRRTLPFNGNPDRIRFLKRFKKDIFGTFEKDHDVKLYIDDESGIAITGTKDDIANCGRRLKKEHDAIFKEIHTIEHQAMMQHIDTDTESIMIAGLKTDCVVVKHKEDMIMEAVVPLFTRSSPAAGIRYSMTLPSGSSCEVQRVDMTSMACDAIVNAANGELQHVGGLALAVLEKGKKPDLDLYPLAGNAAFTQRKEP